MSRGFRQALALWLITTVSGLAQAQDDHSHHNHGSAVSIDTGPPLAESPDIQRLPERMGHDAHMARRDYLFVRMDRLEQQADADAQVLDMQVSYGDGYRKAQLEVDLLSDQAQKVSGGLEARYAWAASPFWDFQAGLQRTVGMQSSRTWVRFGFEGLAPYWFHLQGGVGLAPDGQSQLDILSEYDLLFTQRLILQTRMSALARGKADPDEGRPGGWQSLSGGWRLRYEFSRQFAPYVGIEWSWDRTSMNHEDAVWVVGMRAWF